MTSTFETRPSQEFIAAWREHISATGEPETFPGVSTDKADRHVPVILLSGNIMVPVSKRRDGKRVACPLCSPTAPKFSNGRMAWFPLDGHARFIGHRCARNHLGDEYVTADRLFRLEEDCRRVMEMWPKLQAILPDLKDIVDKLYVRARNAEDARMSIVVTGKGFASFLFHDLVHRNGLMYFGEKEQSHKLAGLAMLSPNFNPTAVAEKAINVCGILRTPLPHWRVGDGENEALKAIVKRGRQVKAALSGLLDLRNQLNEAAAFPTFANMQLLQRWVRAGQSPFSTLSVVRTGKHIGIEAVSFENTYSPSFREDNNLAEGLPTIEKLNALGLREIID